jgi:hypothetical protein
MKVDLTEVRLRAREQIDAELFHEAVRAEKARLRARPPKTSFWQRLANLLPFTITFNWRK